VCEFCRLSGGKASKRKIEKFRRAKRQKFSSISHEKKSLLDRKLEPVSFIPP